MGLLRTLRSTSSQNRLRHTTFFPYDMSSDSRSYFPVVSSHLRNLLARNNIIEAPPRLTGLPPGAPLKNLVQLLQNHFGILYSQVVEISQSMCALFCGEVGLRAQYFSFRIQAILPIIARDFLLLNLAIISSTVSSPFFTFSTGSSGTERR
jgi:hypothetical protein